MYVRGYLQGSENGRVVTIDFPEHLGLILVFLVCFVYLMFTLLLLFLYLCPTLHFYHALS
jgi:hypothetical protein